MSNLEEYQEVYQQHGHWIILGISLVITFYTIFFSGIKKEKKILQKTFQTMNAVKEKIVKIKIPKQQTKNYFSHIYHNWEQTYSVLPGVDNSALYPIAKFVLDIEGPPREKVIMPPRNMRAHFSRESIELNWQDPKLPSALKNAKLCKIEGYILVKTYGGKKREIFVPWETNSYTDTNVEEGEKYYYKIRCFSLNTYAQKGFKISYRNRWVIASSFVHTKSVELPSLYRTKLLGVSGDTAILQLQKWHRGDWYKTTCTVKKNAFVTKRVKVNGQIIDFRPGWVIKSLTTKYPYSFPIDRKIFIKFSEMGEAIYEIKRIQMKTLVCAIRYMDKKGQIKTLIQKK